MFGDVSRRFGACSFWTAIVLCWVLGCSSESADLNAVFGTKQVLDVVKRAERVEAFRLAPESFNKRSLAEYDIVGDPVPVSEADAEALAAILTDPATYKFDIAKGCDPEYGVGVRFLAGNEKVTVLFCFECDILTVYRGDAAVGGEDFDPARGRLVALVQRVFPDDEELREL